MSTPAAPPAQIGGSLSPGRLLSGRVVAAAAFLVALWFVLCRHLGQEWSINEQYNYGWFVPFFAAYLFWLRWESRPQSTKANAEHSTSNAQRPMLIGIAMVALLLLLVPIRLFEVANPDWRPIGWLHALAVVAVTLACIAAAGGARWLRHFAFPVAFFLVAVPWPSVFEQPIVQGLMRLIAAAAAETLTLFGIPAELEGNLIRVNSGLVGVNEACSGVRSLQTSLMIGLLFGELKRLSAGRRIALVGGALLTALLANFARAFWLVWIAATRDVADVSRWHDLAGYSIVCAVFIVTILLAAKLGPNAQRPTPNVERRAEDCTKHSALRVPQSAFLVALVWLIAVEVGVEAWYRLHEARSTPEPGWTIAWPENAPGFRELPIDEGVRATLRFDRGREASWNAPPARYLLYFFRWNPGGSSVARARAHRPDICLPSAGWRILPGDETRTYAAGNNLALTFRRISFEHKGGAGVAHTYFNLHEDRRTAERRSDLHLPAGVQPDWAFPARWAAVRNGVRNMGQQVTEFIILAPHQVTAADADARFAQLLPTLVKPQR